MQKFSQQFLPLGLPALLVFGVAASGAAHAAHPFITDDTGTQGKGHWQLEVNTDHTRVKKDGETSRSQVVDAGLTYGAADTLDVGVNLPWQYHKPVGAASEKGVGDATLQARWRLYDNGAGWSMALKPALTVPAGNASEGLGAGRSTASLNLLGQYQKDQWTWMVNGGMTWNDDKAGDRKGLWNASTAVLYSPTGQWTLGTDVSVSRNPDPASNKHLSYALLGVQYHISKDVDVDAGYRRSLHSGPVEHTVGAGLAVRW